MSDLVEKRITHKGDEWCVESEDGSRNLGCGPSEKWAKKRLAQIEYFKHKSFSDESILKLLEGELSSEVANDPLYKSFIEKHCGECIEDVTPYGLKVGHVDDVEDDIESIEENYDKPRKDVGKGLSEKEVLNKHLPGHHDQVAHAGSIRSYSAKNALESEITSTNDASKIALGKRAASHLEETFNHLRNNNLEMAKLNLAQAIKFAEKAGFDRSGDRLRSYLRELKGTTNNLEPEIIKHLPGKHDQKEHAGQAQAAMAKAPTNWAKANKMRDEVVSQMKQTMRAKGIGKEMRAKLQASMDRLNQKETMKDLPTMTPAFAEANKLLNEVQGKLPAVDLNKGAVNVRKPSGSQGPPKAVPKAPQPVAPELTHPRVSPKRAAAMKKEAKGWVRGMFDSLENSLTKLGDYADSKLFATVKNIKTKQAYNDWYTKQATARKLAARLNREQRQTNDAGIPPYSFYETAKQLAAAQNQALVAQRRFEASMGVQQSSVAYEKVLFEKSKLMEMVEKHLPGKHDQQSHTPAEKKKYAISSGATFKDIEKKLISLGFTKGIASTLELGNLPLFTKKFNDSRTLEIIPHLNGKLFSGKLSHPSLINVITFDVSAKRLGEILPLLNSVNLSEDAFEKVGNTIKKSLTEEPITKADQSCLKQLWGQYYKYYSGKWIAAAWKFYQAKQYSQAAQAFEKARDGFQADKNPTEYKCLDSWVKDAEGQVGGEQKHLPIETEWRITKASVTDNGVMTWQATTTKFSRDVQKDKVTRQFYEEAIKRFKSKVAPTPFFSVAHYSVYDCDNCGYVYKSLSDYICPNCGTDRLIAGIATDMWIDGQQPKARGIFYPTALGKSVFESIRKDIQTNTPQDERVRISMGFYPDPGTGTIVKSSGERDFMSGWVEHFAGTRVPVVPETPITIGVEKSMLNIKTKSEDAEAVLADKSLAQRLQKAELQKRIGKADTSDGLVIKAKPKMDMPMGEEMAQERECPHCGSKMSMDEVDCPECGKMVGKAIPPQFMKKEEKKPAPQAEEKVAEPVADEETPEEEAAELPDEEVAEDEKDKKNVRVEADFGNTFSKSGAEDSIMQDAMNALEIVQKAIAAPDSGNKTQLLSQAANLVNAIRDYAHSVASVPAPVTADGTSAAAVQDLNPASQPGQQTGGNQELVTEDDVEENPNIDQDQEEALEDEEMESAQSGADQGTGDDEDELDEAEEERLALPKLPTNTAKTQAEQKPTTTPPAKGKMPTQPNPGVVEEGENVVEPAKVDAKKKRLPPFMKKSKAQVFTSTWADQVAQVIEDESLGRLDKMAFVQKALNEFAPKVVELVTANTPQSPQDIEAVVKAQIDSAMEQQSSRYEAVIAQLVSQVEQLKSEVVAKEVKSVVGASRRPDRRSLGALRPPEMQPVVKSQDGPVVPVLTGDQVPIRKFSAKEIAQQSIQTGGFRY